MRGYDGKTAKTNMTVEFSFAYGASGDYSSQLDNAAKTLYRALGLKSQSKDEEPDLLEEIAVYFMNCFLLDDKIRWNFTKKVFE